MKSTFTRVMVSSLLIAFAVGCGKKDSGSSPAPVKKTTTTVGALNQTGTKAYSAFKSWYTSSSNGAYPSPNLYVEERTVYSTDTSSACNEQPIKIFGTEIGSINTCNYGSGSSGQNVIEKDVAVLFGGSKSSNKLLESIYKGSVGKLIWAEQTAGMSIQGSRGTLYKLRFQKSDGTLREYWIDTAINSAFQPVKAIDSSTATETVLTGIELNY